MLLIGLRRGNGMLKIKHLSKVFNGKHLKVLDDISFQVGPSEIVIVTGPSGCGKTTLLRIISGNITHFEGAINTSFSKTGFVFQEDRLLEWKTVFENVCLVAQDGNKERAMELLREVGLGGFESYHPKDLSGGMRQRCAIARALFYGSDILLLDEPFRSLDHKLRQEMLKLVNEIKTEEKTAVLFVTHDIDEALKLADKIIVLTKRPARVAGVFTISTDTKRRNLDSCTFQKLKEKIISLLEE
jgi:NitT/TauT family transport system ATP-binding protein